MATLSIRFVLCTATLAASGIAARADVAAEQSLPIPPGAKPTLELSVSDADLLPAIKQALPAVAAALPRLLGGRAAPAIEPAQVEAIFRDVQSIEAVVSTLPAGPAPAVAKSYEDNLTKQGWRRLFWMQSDDAGDQILIMSPEAEPGLFGLVVSSDKAGQQVTAIAFRLRGPINIAPIVGLVIDWFTPAPPTAHPAPPKE